MTLKKRINVWIKPKLGDLWSRGNNHLQDLQTKIPHSFAGPKIILKSLKGRGKEIKWLGKKNQTCKWSLEGKSEELSWKSCKWIFVNGFSGLEKWPCDSSNLWPGFRALEIQTPRPQFRCQAGLCALQNKLIIELKTYDEKQCLQLLKALWNFNNDFWN